MDELIRAGQHQEAGHSRLAQITIFGNNVHDTLGKFAKILVTVNPC
jgi:hypothetical protein